MAQDFISAIFGAPPDYSNALTPQQTEQMRTNALTQGGIGALIALLGASGPQARPIGTGQALAGALGAGFGGYQSSFDNTLKQLLTSQQLGENKQKQEARKRYEQAIAAATTKSPTGIGLTDTGIGSQLQMLRDQTADFGTEGANITAGALMSNPNLPMQEVVDPVAAQTAALNLLRDTDIAKYLELTIPKAEATPASLKEYEKGVSQGFKGTFQEWQLQQKATGAPVTNITLNTEKSYGGAIAGKIADIDAARYDVASRAPAVLDQVDRTRKILESDNVFVGALADPKLQLARFGQEIGVTGKNTNELVANTQLLMAGRAQATLDSIKASGLGSGQGFTDKDRQFLENARLGNISYSKNAIAQQLDIEEKVAKASAKVWNDRFEQIPNSAKDPLGLQKIILPTSSKTPASPTGIKRFNPATGKLE